MILSILDNDLYKFTMQQAVCRLYPHAEAEYRFTDRGNTSFPKGMKEALEAQISDMAGMALTPGQREWLERRCPYFDARYLDYLMDYRFCPDEVQLQQQGQHLELTVKGPWHRAILWEVPLMALISEIYFTLTAPRILDREAVRKKNQYKTRYMAENQIPFADFGTRRRFSSENHDHLMEDILAVDGHTMTGTSNVHLARKWDIAPIGTMAHEWIMFHSALGDYDSANTLALDAWLKVYPDVLGIALTDTYTTDAFLAGFDSSRAGTFPGVRHDSGDPSAFIRRMIDHYQNLGIDPSTKTIVFSDGLSVEDAGAIHTSCRGRVKDSYGIGTHLTNDVGPDPLNMVIKLSRCRLNPEDAWHKTVKLSDDRGKHTGDAEELARCLRHLKIKSQA